MKELDAWKRMLKIKSNIYEWLVMPFGITNNTTIFMRLIKDLFISHLGNFLIIYLDDNFTFS
jgi:hypothetical protein